MSATEIGRLAEARAADFLQKQGFKILEQNWRTRYCEIDVVAQKEKIMYFVEVKYRGSANQGYGFDYITPKKLKQMRFAAEMWVQTNRWSDDYQLAAISIDANHIDFIDSLMF